MAEPQPDQSGCRGCGEALGTRHREECPYAHPWPRDRVDNVQTRIDPVRASSASDERQAP